MMHYFNMIFCLDVMGSFDVLVPNMKDCLDKNSV